MKIIVKKDPEHADIYWAQFGRRQIIICLPKLHVSLGITPSAAAVRQAFDDCTRPGEGLMDQSAEVVFQ